MIKSLAREEAFRFISDFGSWELPQNRNWEKNYCSCSFKEKIAKKYSKKRINKP